MFVISAGVLFFHIRSIRRLVKVAEVIDPEVAYQKLPYKHLPIELQPLIISVNKLLEKVVKARKRERFFLSSAAHELRTPLAALRARLVFIEDAELQGELIGDVSRLSSLTKKLLQLMRLNREFDRLDLVDLVQVCRDVVTSSGGRDLLYSAISNLVDNAVSFSPEGSKVHVNLAADGRLTVRDSGPGVDPEAAAFLFEPFGKFPPGRDGHGLGLAIVEAIAAMHKAELQWRNLEQGGAEFSLGFTKSQSFE